MVTAEQLQAWLSIPSASIEELAEMGRVCAVAQRYVESQVLRQHLTNEVVNQAVLMLAARLWNRRHSPFGIVEMDGFATGVRTDRDVDMLIAPYRKIVFA